MNYKNLILVALVGLFLIYSFYIYFNLPIINKVISTSADKGKEVWQKYNCNSCHQIYGLGGYLGPDLTNEYSSKGELVIKAFLKNGTKIMPQFPIKESELKDLISFMKQIDSFGKSSPNLYKIYKNGTIEN